jgi:ribosomal protein L11 methylase PrmA
VGGIVRVALGSLGPEGPFPGPYDLVVANIIADVLIELAPDLARRTEHEDWVALVMHTSA